MRSRQQKTGINIVWNVLSYDWIPLNHAQWGLQLVVQPVVSDRIWQLFCNTFLLFGFHYRESLAILTTD